MRLLKNLIFDQPITGVKFERDVNYSVLEVPHDALFTDLPLVMFEGLKGSSETNFSFNLQLMRVVGEYKFEKGESFQFVSTIENAEAKKQFQNLNKNLLSKPEQTQRYVFWDSGNRLISITENIDCTRIFYLIKELPNLSNYLKGWYIQE